MGRECQRDGPAQPRRPGLLSPASPTEAPPGSRGVLPGVLAPGSSHMTPGVALDRPCSSRGPPGCSEDRETFSYDAPVEAI